MRRFPEERARIWDALKPLVEEGAIRPTVGVVYEGLERVPDALVDLAARRISGKAVVRVASEEEAKARL